MLMLLCLVLRIITEVQQNVCSLCQVYIVTSLYCSCQGYEGIIPYKAIYLFNCVQMLQH